MNLDNRLHMLVYVVVGGLLFYGSTAIWSAFFIIALPQDPGWCADVVQIQTGENSFDEQCVAFKDHASELKHYHNQRMVQRNKYWLYFRSVLGALLGALVFHTIPRWRRTPSPSTALTGGLALGAVVAFLAPLVFGWMLPSPIDWFPRELAEIHSARQAVALRELGFSVP